MKVKNNTEKRFKDLNLRISWQDRRIYVSINDKNKKIKYRAENPNEKSLICYKIDDSNRINKDAMRCDSGLYIDELSTSNRDRLILIEFKGSNVNEAIEQIKSTVKDLIITPKITIDKLDACIVLKKNPNPKYWTPDMIKLNKCLYKYGKGKLKVEEAKNINEIL